ncbi:hypothetical protein C8Q76DRAFT_613345 [Earliella scabrosa]|nr:hypothetical protein C8Q76DRAFT_613345 [Earliella scabrosa]
MVAQLHEVDWTIGDFLYMLFRTKDANGQPVELDKGLETSLSKFLCGHTVHKPIEIVQLWLDHPFSHPATTAKHYEPLYSFDTPYLAVKHAKAAITSMAVQLCKELLLHEVRAAVRGRSGLHGSQDAGRGRKRLAWSDIGPHTVAVEVLSTLDFSHTAHARLLPAARSILYFACGASHVLWSYGSRTGQTQSWSTTYTLLRELARQDAAELVTLGRDPTRWFMKRIDNVQQHHKQRERRVGRENAMRVGVAGLVAEVENFRTGADDLDDKLRRIAMGLRKELTTDKLLDMIDFDHLEEMASLQWVQTLVNYVPCLRVYKAMLAKAYKDVAKLLVPTRKTRIHPLAPVAKNEAVTTDLRDTIVDFLRQVGQEENSSLRRIVPIGGDGLTFEKIIKMKHYLQRQESEFHRLDAVVPFLEIWHTEWAYISAVYETHFQSSLTPDPSKLGHSATKIDQKAPTSLKKVDYYKDCFTAYKTLEARQIDCWRIHYGVENLLDYFAKLVEDKTPLPTFDELRIIARKLNADYASTRAYNNALRGMKAGRSWPDGSGWTSSSAAASAQTSEESDFKGDQVLAQSILFMRDTIVSKMTAEAVARGDIGTVYEALKWMTFCFEGSSHSRYCSYMLEMTCNLELESSPQFRQTFLENWLVNPSGEPDGNQEGDLMEEHYNRVLEEFVERKSMEWDDPYLQEVVAPNVDHFSGLKNTWGTGVGLAERRGRHPEPHSRPEMKILLNEYATCELHSFRSGRKYHSDSTPTTDMFQAGLESLEGGKLQKWVKETTRSRSVAMEIIGEGEQDEGEEEGEPEPVLGNEEVGDEDSTAMQTRGRMRLVDGELVVEYDESLAREAGGLEEETDEERESVISSDDADE